MSVPPAADTVEYNADLELAAACSSGIASNAFLEPAGWAGKGSKWACGKRVKYLLDLQARLQTRQEDDA